MVNGKHLSDKAIHLCILSDIKCGIAIHKLRRIVIDINQVKLDQACVIPASLVEHRHVELNQWRVLLIVERRPDTQSQHALLIGEDKVAGDLLGTHCECELWRVFVEVLVKDVDAWQCRLGLVLFQRKVVDGVHEEWAIVVDVHDLDIQEHAYLKQAAGLFGVLFARVGRIANRL